MADIWLENCKLPGITECAVGIENGKFIALKKIAPAGEDIKDLKGAVVLPGLIDAHTHLRDPGLTYKEDFRSGTEAAACGGFTTVLDMPNTQPPTDTALAFKQKLKIGKKKSLVDFGFHAGVGDLSEIKKVAKYKPASFKIFMDGVGQSFMKEAFNEISMTPLSSITLHAEDRIIVRDCTEKEKSTHNLNPEIYALARPPLAETTAISEALLLARNFDMNLHFCHVSTKESLGILDKAKNEGMRVTSEVTPHHLLLDSHYLGKYGNFAKTNPPLRDVKNKLGLENLNEIDIIGTDHAPHTISEKKQNVWDAPPGIPNLETTLPLLLTLINRNEIGFNHIKRLLCHNPSRIFRLESKGFIKVGMDADLVVIDMKKEWTINPDEFKSKAKYSPFEGFEIKGMPVMTMVRGNVVMEEGEVYENNGTYAL